MAFVVLLVVMLLWVALFAAIDFVVRWVAGRSNGRA